MRSQARLSEGHSYEDIAMITPEAFMDVLRRRSE